MKEKTRTKQNKKYQMKKNQKTKTNTTEKTKKNKKPVTKRPVQIEDPTNPGDCGDDLSGLDEDVAKMAFRNASGGDIRHYGSRRVVAVSLF